MTTADFPETAERDAPRPQRDAKAPALLASLAQASWLLPVATSMASGAAYIATLAPTISILDSPELSAAAITLGVAHPTGYPLFTAVGHLATQLLALLAIGSDPAWRLNLLTAVTAAAATGLIAVAGRRLTGRASAGWLAALLFGLSPSFWREANVAEVYALHIFFAAAMLVAWLRWEELPSTSRLRVLALLCGLSFTHHLMTALLGPMLLLAVVVRPRRWPDPREAIALLGCFLLPLSLTLYLPLVAASDPLVNWGNPETWQTFLAHVTGFQFHSNLDAPSLGFSAALTGSVGNLAREFGGVLLPFAAIGAVTVSRELWIRVAVAVGFGTGLLFGLSYGVVDSEPFFLNAHLFVALWIGAGTAFSIRWLGARSAGAARFAEGLVWLAPVAALALHAGASDRSNEYEPHDHAVAALSSLPPGAVLLTQGPEGYPPVYAQLVEKLRPDVDVVDMFLRVRGSYGPDLDRLRASPAPPGQTWEETLVQTVAAMDGNTRSLWLMPRVPDLDWQRLGLYRMRGGVIDPLVRQPPDLRRSLSPVGSGPASIALIEDGDFDGRARLVGMRADRTQVEAGTALTVDYEWLLGERFSAMDAPLYVRVLLADRDGDAPMGHQGRPLVEQDHPLGQGLPLERYLPGDLIRERVTLLVPRAIEPGTWSLWVALLREGEWIELSGGRLFTRASEIHVQKNQRPLWSLRR